MTIEFALPELGEGIEEADVLRVLVSPGDSVEVEQGVIEVETEKATLEVPAPAAGRIGEVRVASGETIRVGQVIVTIDEAAGAAGEARAPAAAPASAPPEPAPPAPPEPEPGPSPAAAAPEPAPPAAPAPADEAAPEPAPPARPAPAPASPAAPVHREGEPVFAAPSVRTFAREIGVDIREVAGSGPGGRISQDDVKRHARSRPAGGLGRGAPAPDPGAGVDFARWGEVERLPMSRVRRTTAETISRSWQSPHVTLFQKADVTELEALRRRYRERVSRAGGGNLTMVAILLSVCASALRQHPRLNASVDAAARQIVYKKHVHIGVAVDTDRGLLVPVLRDADRKNVTELSAELGSLAVKAREGKLGLEEMRGGSFTISNLGGMGTGFFTPILNPPEVGILGVGRALTEAVWDAEAGAFAPRLLLPLSLSFDHRIVDGADGARFLSWVVEALEQPLLLALEG
ncbi:MAG: dihydrolipoamide acetyltransferase family protein [Chloroflexi bacterium]|nr:dihydrolipoamide acetyltransferase family protein [Chloroflexota bacterium]